MDDQTAVTRTTGTPTVVAVAPPPSLRPAGPRTPDQIERDIELTRARLAGTIDELGYRVKPATIAKRTADKAKATVIDETGAPRTNRIAVIGGAVAAVIGLVVWRRRR